MRILLMSLGSRADIMSGIVTLTLDGEPLNDGDPEDCFFDYDPGGNNTVDFGFHDANTTSVTVQDGEVHWTSVYPNPLPIGSPSHPATI